jgi:hypothetical protein
VKLEGFVCVCVFVCMDCLLNPPVGLVLVVCLGVAVPQQELERRGCGTLPPVRWDEKLEPHGQVGGDLRGFVLYLSSIVPDMTEAIDTKYPYTYHTHLQPTQTQPDHRVLSIERDPNHI